MICVISDYSARALLLARRVKAVIIADRPGPTIEQDLLDAKAAGEIKGLIIIDTTGDTVPGYPGAPQRPRQLILTNGAHSNREAIAFDLHVRGYGIDQIGELMGVDAETARTFVRRAERKNKVDPEVDCILRHLMATE